MIAQAYCVYCLRVQTRSALELSRNDHIYCRMVVVQLTSGTIAKEMLFSSSHAIDTLKFTHARHADGWFSRQEEAEPAMRHAELRVMRVYRAGRAVFTFRTSIKLGFTILHSLALIV